MGLADEHFIPVDDYEPELAPPKSSFTLVAMGREPFERMMAERDEAVALLRELDVEPPQGYDGDRLEMYCSICGLYECETNCLIRRIHEFLARIDAKEK